jgi:hypothetical protein
MNCSHVLGLIDAGPLADYPAAHLDAAWRHARACATCGPALEAATALTAALTALPHPVQPRDLEAIVMAHIARIEKDVEMAAAGAVAAKREQAPRSRVWPACATTVGGLASGLAIVVAMHPVGLASPRVGAMTASLVAMPPFGAWALVLAAGLLLYVAGLFGNVTGSEHR